MPACYVSSTVLDAREIAINYTVKELGPNMGYTGKSTEWDYQVPGIEGEVGVLKL